MLHRINAHTCNKDCMYKSKMACLIRHSLAATTMKVFPLNSFAIYGIQSHLLGTYVYVYVTTSNVPRKSTVAS